MRDWTRVPRITLDQLQLEDTGSDEIKDSRLLGCINIGGQYVHVELHQVVVDEAGLQQAADPVFADEVDAAQTLQDGALETIGYRGKQYIVLATSYGA